MEEVFRLTGSTSTTMSASVRGMQPNPGCGCARTRIGRMVWGREEHHGYATRSPRMRLDPNVVAFGRHESFPLRFGWITKGLDAVQVDPGVFAREDATVTLGVGKNMVASIRHWLQASRLAEPLGRHTLVPTEIARIAFGEGGDPYLEDDATIWLLHWLLSSNPRGATAIYWFFNHFHKPIFTTEEAVTGLIDFAKQETAARTAVTTLKRDANLVLRMYTQTVSGNRLTLEDALDSPLALLGMQERLEARRWRSVPTDRIGLPISVFAFAVAELFDAVGAPQLAIDQLMYSDRDHCGVGAVFRMTEEGLVSQLETLCDSLSSQLRLTRTAGVLQLHKLAPFPPLPLLQQYYGNTPTGVAACP